MPYRAIKRKYHVWKYGEEAIEEMELEGDEYIEENEFDEYTVVRSNLLARAIFLFCA